MPYTDKTAIQNYLLVNIDDSFNAQITEWITAVDNWINDYCNRISFTQEADTDKLYDGNGSSEILVDDLISCTKIEILDDNGNVDYTIDAVTEYYLYPTNKTPKTRIVINKANAPIGIFPRGNQNVKVTGVFGYAATVPEQIKLAATKLVASIIMEGNYDVGSEIKSERLGEYDITYQDIDGKAEKLGIKDILDQYRNLPI